MRASDWGARLSAESLVQNLAHARPEVRGVQQDVALHGNVEEAHGCERRCGRRAQRAPGPLGRARRAARAAAPHSPGSGASVAARALPRHARGRGHLTVRTPSRRVFGLAREPPECLRRAARAMEGAPAGAAPEPRTRKPYTITKQRECWTEEEHQRFLDALKLHGRAWRRIEGAWLRRAPRRPGAPLPQPLPPRSLLWRSPSGVGEPTSLAPYVRFCAAVGPGNVR
jgi:hypothetical protein